MKKMTILNQSRDNCKEARGKEKNVCLSASFVAETKECFHKQEEFIYLIKSVAKPFTRASAVIAKNRLGLLVEKIFHDFWTILNIHFLIIKSQYTDQSLLGNYENILH